MKPSLTDSPNSHLQDENKFLGQKERRRSSGVKMFLGDYLSLATNQSILKILAKSNEQTVAFSDVVIKINKRNKMQERILLITGQSTSWHIFWKLICIFLSFPFFFFFFFCWKISNQPAPSCISAWIETGLYNIDPGSYKVKRRIPLKVPLIALFPFYYGPQSWHPHSLCLLCVAIRIWGQSAWASCQTTSLPFTCLRSMTTCWSATKRQKLSRSW